MSKPGKRRPRTAQRQDDSDSEAQDLRPLCRALQFWRVCGKAPCRRARDCLGDAQACFRQFWWQLPEEARVWVRAAIAASAGGMRNKAAGLAADAEVARWQDLQRAMRRKPHLKMRRRNQQRRRNLTTQRPWLRRCRGSECYEVAAPDRIPLTRRERRCHWSA